MSSESLEFEITRKFRERVNRGDIAEDTRIIYQISGGMPDERVEETIDLSGTGVTKITVLDEPKSKSTREVTAELDREEASELFQKIMLGLDSLVPRSEAHFLPDSLVGSITVQVEGEEVMLFFLADEEERASQDKPIAPQINEAIQRFTEISRRLMK